MSPSLHLGVLATWFSPLRNPTKYVFSLRSFEMIWYCWWLKSCTTWDVWNPINNGDIYHINWCRISSINSSKSIPRVSQLNWKMCPTDHRVGASRPDTLGLHQRIDRHLGWRWMSMLHIWLEHVFMWCVYIEWLYPWIHLKDAWYMYIVWRHTNIIYRYHILILK